MRHLVCGLLIVCGALALAGETTNAGVRLEIVPLPQSTYVIGDAIPLQWRFHNTTNEALAIFWEGCCFSYGEVELKTAAGVQAKMKKPAPGQGFTQPLSPAELEKNLQAWHKLMPPAHIDAGKALTFDTDLANWVELEQSGAYELRARYLGAPAAMLQRKDLKFKMWNGRVEAPPLEVELLTPRDYLQKYAGKPSASGVEVSLALEPAVITPLRGLELNITIHNKSTQPLAMWENSVWILDPTGKRVVEMPVHDKGQFADGFVGPMLAAGDTMTRPVKVPSDKLVGQPFGTGYSVFVDFEAPALGGLQRLPTNAMQFSWQISQADLREMLKAAAPLQGKPNLRKPRSGPLFTLRQHLAELKPLLDGEAANPPENGDGGYAALSYVALVHDLRLAAALKPLAPKPGELGIELREVDGTWLPTSKHVVDAFAWNTPADVPTMLARIKNILRVRNHLGASVTVRLTPHERTRIAAIKSAARELIGGTEILQTGQLWAGSVRLAATFAPTVLYKQTALAREFTVNPQQILTEELENALKELQPATGNWYQKAQLPAGQGRVLAIVDDDLLWSEVPWNELMQLGDVELSLQGITPAK